tara:strand:- start:1065 stop:2513 length:1449 start_codon:yes stop_codon:yes gene_type:complete
MAMVFLLGAFFRVYNNGLFKVAVPLIFGSLAILYYSKRDIEKFLKLAIIIVFLGHNANQYFFILLTVLLFNSKLLISYKSSFKYILLMFFWGFLSYIGNQLNEINLLSLPFFIASFFLPIAFFVVSHKYVNEKMREQLISFYLRIVLILCFSALIQFAIKGSTVDGLTGGTTSAHTLGFHSGVAFLIIASKVLKIFSLKKIPFLEVILLVLVLPVMYLSDSKYLMGNMVLALGLAYMIYHTHNILKPLIITVITLLVILGTSVLKVDKLKFSVKSDVNIAYVSLRFVDSAKFQLLLQTIALPKTDPLVFFFGSGPGTFLSRSANSRAYDTMEKKVNVGGGTSVQVDSKLPSFIEAKTTWVTHKYATRYFYTLWQGTLFDYRSSLISLFWEYGIVGFSLFIAFFASIISFLHKASKKIKGLSAPNLFLQSFILYYFVNSLLAYYFEYPETQIVFWLFIGAFYNKEVIEKYKKEQSPRLSRVEL